MVKLSHLNFVDGLPLLQRLGPHSDDPFVVGHIPALFAQTFGLEAGKRLVVRDCHSVSRHGFLLPRGVDRRARDVVGCVRMRFTEETRWAGEAGSRVSLLFFFCGNNLSNSISSLQQAFVAAARLVMVCARACVCESVCARFQGPITAIHPAQTNVAEVQAERTGELETAGEGERQRSA